MSIPAIAIVGAGLMGRWHAHSAKAIGAKIVGIVDPNLEAAQSLAKRYPTARVFATLEDCLDQCPSDVVHICTPVETHVALIETALKANRHVLAEKPLAPSPEATQALICLARDRSLKLNPIHQFPFQRGVRQILAQRQQLGELVSFSYTVFSAGGTDKTSAERCSILLSILPHFVSLLYPFFERAFDLSTLKVLQFTTDELEITGQIRDISLNCLISLRGRPTRNELIIVGTKGTAYLDLFHGYSVLERDGVSRRAKILKPFRFATSMFLNAGSNLIERTIQFEPAYPGLRELIRLFYSAVINEHPTPITKTEMILVVELTQRVISWS